MVETNIQISITFNNKTVLENIRELKHSVGEILIDSLFESANELVKDSRPFIPVLTGKLRDSGKVQLDQERLFAVRLIWDAANPKNDFIYAQKQYEEVLQHVDGKYAARWVEKSFVGNEQKYINILLFNFKIRLNQLIGNTNVGL